MIMRMAREATSTLIHKCALSTFITGPHNQKSKLMSEVTNRNGALTPSDELFQGDVAAGLEKVRLRLLNLGARNRLLNFPTRPSKQFLRIIDAIPDVVFQKLRNSQELIFRSVPKPPKDSGAMVLFEEFTSNSDVYLDGGIGSEAATAATITRRMKADEYARQLNINTAFDLQDLNLSPGLREEHQNRDFIRAPHYPEELERILKNIAATTKTTIEETGVSTLFLIFGFLEWYEEQKSDAPHFAPLLLVPVSINKGRLGTRTNTYPYDL